MGTRGLTIVRLDGEDKIAQYGQWDHYPEGQGVTVLTFCRKLKTPAGQAKFAVAVRKVRALSDQELQARWTEAGAKGEWVTMDVAEKHKALYPALSRDTGAEILNLVLGGVTEVDNAISFINESLFCEYAYCVNLDDNTLEVYKGFQSKQHNRGRYASDKQDDGYYPCALLATFPLAGLPTKREFLSVLKKAEKAAENGESEPYIAQVGNQMSALIKNVADDPDARQFQAATDSPLN